MRTYYPTYAPPTVDYWSGSISPQFTIYSPDPYDLPVYSLPVPVDGSRKFTASATFSADTAVTAGFKLLIWYGKTIPETLPGQGGFASTLATMDMGTTEATATGTTTLAATYLWLRLVFEIDTCTEVKAGVTTTVSNVTLKKLP
jgi:hypothetical protein